MRKSPGACSSGFDDPFFSEQRWDKWETGRLHLSSTIAKAWLASSNRITQRIAIASIARRKSLEFNSPPRQQAGRIGGQLLGKAAALVPNILTLSAILCGLTSIKLSAESQFAWAAAAIAGAVMLDVLDGYAARRLNAASEIGAELDSLADFVNFGVAPAILLYERDLHLIGWAGWLAAGTYVLATGFRLARFNVRSKHAREHAPIQGFEGLPSTGAAAAILIASGAASFALAPGQYRAVLISAVIAISALMVSRIRIPSLSMLFNRRELRRRQS
jgi:CDP-diacylglycerol---serine O-phosphatidyltransferase